MIKKYLKESITDRTKRANLNIIISFFFKGASIFLSFLLVPLTINYIKPDAYGVWLTLSSLVGWFAMFDIGIGNGLKNRLSESLAVQDFERAKVYVSTTYMIISIIAIVLIAIYLVCFQWVNWQMIFNSKFIPDTELQKVVTIVSLFFLLKFITDIINVVASSFQMVSISSILLFLSNLGLVISVWILSKSTKADLVWLAFCLSFIPFLITLFANFYLFHKQFKIVKPSFKYVNFKESKGIMSLGSKFFILQIIVLIIFQTDNILIAQFFEPSEVTNFNIAYKYYSIIAIIFTLIISPYWTAFTEAYMKKDFVWIKGAIGKLKIYWIASILILAFMILVCNWTIHFWVGDDVKIPIYLSLSMCAYITVTNWNAIFANFLNGVGKLKVQIIYAIFMGILNIPICFIFVKIFKFGTFAMPLSNFVCLSLGAIISYIQYVKIINDDARGIWDK